MRMAPDYHGGNNMNRKANRMHPASFILILMMALTMIFCFQAPVYAAEGTDGTEMQVLEAEQLEIQLGADWAGVEFELKTDAGMYPGTIAVGEDGVLRLEIGGSSSYILTCLNSNVAVPEPAQASATDEVQSDGQTEMETAGQDAAGEADSDQPEDLGAGSEIVQESEQPESEDQETESQDNTIAGIPVIHIIMFAVGMVLAVGCLITMYVLKKHRENLADDDDLDADYEEMDD